MMAPIASIRGKIANGYYARVMYGKQVIQRCPIRTKPPTDKQLEARRIFVEKYKKKRKNTEEHRSGNEVVSKPAGNLKASRIHNSHEKPYTTKIALKTNFPRYLFVYLHIFLYFCTRNSW